MQQPEQPCKAYCSTALTPTPRTHSLQEVLDLLLWSVRRLQQSNAPTVALAAQTLQFIQQVRCLACVCTALRRSCNLAAVVAAGRRNARSAVRDRRSWAAAPSPQHNARHAGCANPTAHPTGMNMQTKLYFLIFDRYSSSYVLEWLKGLLGSVK